MIYQLRDNLLSVGNDAKTVKGQTFGYLTGILYLAPERTVKGANLCPMAATAKCNAACLYTAGRGKMSSVQQARINRTQYFLNDRQAFMEHLATDIMRVAREARHADLIPAIRLNGTSDILWERESVELFGTVFPNLMAAFPQIQFYDYSKRPNRIVPDNYHLTFSYSEANPDFAEIAMSEFNRGINIAVVFDKVPDTWKGYTVVDGDKSDLRFLDPANVIVGLKAKGEAKRDNSGFVVRV